MRWSRKTHKEAKARAAEARELRKQAEDAEAEVEVRVKLPMAKLRKENHVVEDLVRLIRKAPG